MIRIPLLWKLPIKGKLILIIMATSVSVLLLTAAAFTVHQRSDASKSMIRDTSTLARLVASRSTAALLFDDPNLCKENLAALRGIPSIVAGGIYNAKGDLVASYGAFELPRAMTPQGPTSSMHRFEGDSLTVFEPILSEDASVGTVCIRANLVELKVMSREYLVAAFGILLLGTVAAFLLSSRLQQIVSGPISKLTETARLVANGKDYSLRATKVYEDELGLLVETFNGMLEQIQQRDRVLQETNEHLETQVQTRTSDLRAANDQLEAILEAARSGIVLAKGRAIARCNRQLEVIFGYEPGEMINQSTRIWYPDEATFEATGAEIAAAVARGELFFKDLQLIRKDGSLFWGRMKVQTLDRADAFKGVVGLIEDVTQERDYAENLRKAMEAAEAADRIKSAFLATMSHELRTPLNSIIGFTGILLQGLVGELNPEQKKQLGMVKDSSNHLLDLINDVLDISKIEAGQLKLSHEPFDLRASIEKTVQTIRPLAVKKGLTLELNLTQDVLNIKNDRRRVEQVMFNLLSNAIKFTEQGSVRIDCRRRDATIVVEVKDTGIGIKPEDLEHLFKPFSQIDVGLTRKYEGTGLGLSICKRLVEFMGGEIWVESRVNEGSTFAFTLPLR